MATATHNGQAMLTVQQKYAEEAAKRLRQEGIAQFIELKEAQSDRFRELAKDPWVDHDALNSQAPPVRNGGTYKFVILGAGYGGLLFAVRLIQAGVASGPNDIRFVDAAGGFGGTWYWNRYPGLHCDVESYTYMPLLEETGYMPTAKYVSGTELLEHAHRIADKWNLLDKALFRTDVRSAAWNDANNLWTINATEDRGPNEQAMKLQFHSQYLLIASGILTRPQIPKIPGLHTFAGPMVHAARWDYSVTGGSPADPNLTALAGKRVGIIGTGATTVQVLPQVAKSSKEVYVFQRTPSAIHWRGQRPTDHEEWKTKISAKKGWQMERMMNFNSYVENAAKAGEENLTGDAWTEMPGYSAVIGGPSWGLVEPTPEKIGEHVRKLHMLDMPRAEAARARVDQIVKNPETAAKLKAWYPVWCKRPTFSDDYLQAFNLPNVHLVDTGGKGLSAATAAGLVVDGKEYPLDVLILCTGFRTPAIGNGSPAARTAIDIFGRQGRSFDEEWQARGAATLHGIYTNGYPNLFLASTSQAGIATNFVLVLDVTSRHVAHIVAEAERRAEPGTRPVLEPSVDAQEDWSMECMRRATWFAGVAGCTPGYITSEGQAMSNTDPTEVAKQSRGTPWCEGMTSYVQILEKWRADGMEGIEITGVPAI